ncbi:MAG: shikimate kinase [Planctomyces sp.]|nr:shikimate kinase [Planctomyces sp.]
MTITLIGYRGTGKSRIGARLAERLGQPFVDADVELVRRAGRSIADIFRDAGEAEFRRLEAELLEELLDGSPRVVASGGGAVLDARTRERMRSAGPVIWLQADAPTILARLAADPASAGQRPALTGLPPEVEVRQLLAVREPLYAQTATLELPTADRDVESLVTEIIDRLGPDATAPDASEIRR